MSEQPEALYLADNADKTGAHRVAAELRRQFEEIKRLHALNAELLEALKGVLVWGTDEDWKNAKIWCEKARAAIAKAEREQA